MTTPTSSLTKLVARRIREFRHERDWSQVDLEAATDQRLSRSEISYLETGKRRPTLATIEILAEAFEVYPAALLLDRRHHQNILNELESSRPAATGMDHS